MVFWDITSYRTSFIYDWWVRGGWQIICKGIIYFFTLKSKRWVFNFPIILEGGMNFFLKFATFIKCIYRVHQSFWQSMQMTFIFCNDFPKSFTLQSLIMNGSLSYCLVVIVILPLISIYIIYRAVYLFLNRDTTPKPIHIHVLSKCYW